jgi:hypothetical protein
LQLFVLSQPAHNACHSDPERSRTGKNPAFCSTATILSRTHQRYLPNNRIHNHLPKPNPTPSPSPSHSSPAASPYSAPP